MAGVGPPVRRRGTRACTRRASRDGGGVCAGLRGAACFSAAHGLSPECAKCVTSCRQFVAESRNRLCQLYLAALGLGVVLLFFRKPGWQPLLALAAAFGLVDVFCMAQVYIHASVATWQHSNTLALFFGTSGIIGSVVIALAYLRNAGTAMRCAVVVVALMVLIRLIMQPLWLADINAVDTTIVTFPHHPLQALAQLRDVYLLGWCVSAAGMLCFAAGGLRNARGTLVAGSVLLLIGEIMLRYVFFSIG